MAELNLEEQHYDILEYILNNPFVTKNKIMVKFNLSDWHTRQAINILKGNDVIVSRGGDLSVRDDIKDRLRKAFYGGNENERERTNNNKEEVQQTEHVPETGTETSNQTEGQSNPEAGTDTGAGNY